MIATAAFGQSAEPAADFWSRFRDPSDGKFDVTATSEGGSGFLPLAIPFNEPAIGVGLLGAALYFHPDRETGGDDPPALSNAPPTTSFGVVGVSDNDSWIAGGGHAATLKGGRIRYLGALGTASLNLDFYGIGGDVTVDEPISFNIAGEVLVQQAQFQLGASKFAAGFNYSLFASEVEFNALVDADLAVGETSDAGLAAFLNYDTRDNLFTPNKGTYAEVSVAYFSDALGGDFDYPKFDFKAYHFWQLMEDRLIIGVRGEYAYAGDAAPFYALPWISLRGVPALRYLGNHAVTLEIEPRWKIDGRWSVVGFTGVGRAANHLDALDDVAAAYNYGLGFRYLLARQHGLAAGIDLAYGPEESILTFTIGNAWGS